MTGENKKVITDNEKFLKKTAEINNSINYQFKIMDCKSVLELAADLKRLSRLSRLSAKQRTEDCSSNNF